MSQFERIFLLFLDYLLLLAFSLFLHVSDSKIGKVFYNSNFSLVFGTEFAHFFVLCGTEFGKFGVDVHLDHLSMLVHLLTEISLQILKE